MSFIKWCATATVIRHFHYKNPRLSETFMFMITPLSSKIMLPSGYRKCPHCSLSITNYVNLTSNLITNFFNNLVVYKYIKVCLFLADFIRLEKFRSWPSHGWRLMITLVHALIKITSAKTFTWGHLEILLMRFYYGCHLIQIRVTSSGQPGWD